MRNRKQITKDAKFGHRRPSGQKGQEGDYINPLDFWGMNTDGMEPGGDETAQDKGNRRKSLFFIGADDFSGKTIAICAIGTMLSERGIKVAGIKPIECGTEDNFIFEQAFSMNNSWKDDPLGPYFFKEKLSPYFAFKQSKAGFDKGRIIKLCNGVIAQQDVTFIEGSGGLLDPIVAGCSTADMIKELGSSVVIVSPLKRGTLSQLMMIIAQAKVIGVSIRGVLFSAADKTVTKDFFLLNVQAVRDLVKVPVIGIIPFLEKGSREEILEKCSKKVSFQVMLDFPVPNPAVPEKSPETANKKIHPRGKAAFHKKRIKRTRAAKEFTK
ncbi:MAG: AAA family ATPase [Candidatus Omnitrophota bacterium]